MTRSSRIRRPTSLVYLNPPQHAAVFCVDEKTAIQALDRLDPVLPLSPGRAERHGFEYHRHGTLSLYAALDVKTGKVEGKTAKTRASYANTLRDFRTTGRTLGFPDTAEEYSVAHVYAFLTELRRRGASVL